MLRIAILVFCVFTLCVSPFGATPARAEPPAYQTSWKRTVKGWLRKKIAKEEDIAVYGLELEPTWRQAGVDRDIVVLVHGFNSKLKSNNAVLRGVHRAGNACGWFHYPNDQALDSSARLLSHVLKQFKAAHPDHRIALIAHSMGGLVARACIENPDLDPGNVSRLLMIAPPNHGTFLTCFAIGTDVWEHTTNREGGGPIDRFRASFADGLCEAKEDLEPDSPFLERLNARERNPKVQYTVFLGTGALLRDRDLKWLRRGARWGTKIPLIGDKFDKWESQLADFDEVLMGKGDGIVAVRRGYLPGVKDTRVFNFRHLSVTGEPKSDAIRAVHQAILNRLAQTR